MCGLLYRVIWDDFFGFKNAGRKNLYIVLSFTIILTSIGMEWLYKALEQYTYITVRSVCFKFIALVAMFLLIHEQKDYVIYGGITIFAASASNVLNLINAHKYIDLKPVGNYDFKQHMKPILIFSRCLVQQLFIQILIR